MFIFPIIIACPIRGNIPYFNINYLTSNDIKNYKIKKLTSIKVYKGDTIKKQRPYIL